MITVIGSINLDLIGKIGRIPAPGETVLGDTFTTAPGGKGANQALAAARAGAPTRMIGAVGKDSFAGEALSLLQAGGVDLTKIRESAARTGIAMILVDEAGENVIAVISGANTTVVRGDLAKVDLVAGGVVLLQLEIPLDTVEAALDAAHAAGALSVLNTAPFRAEATNLLAKADYVIANETEFDLYAKALKLTGKGRPERMEAFARSTGRTIIVTLGDEGVIAVSGEGERIDIPAMKIEPVDTVGAGDTFCGYFGAGLLAGDTVEAALRRASVAASLACLKPGAQPSIPGAALVQEHLG